MLAFVMLWAYFNVSQLIIIWSGNLPEEIPWYLDRLHGPGRRSASLVLVGHFVLPFLLLLSRSLKRNAAHARADRAVRAGDARRRHRSGRSARCSGTSGSTTALAGLRGRARHGRRSWLFVFFWRNLAGRALVPAHDPYFKEAMAHGGH